MYAFRKRRGVNKNRASQREKSMGRLPKPAAPYARTVPIFPIPTPADYSDEVTDEDIKVLSEVAKDGKDGGRNDDEWEILDGPGW